MHNLQEMMSDYVKVLYRPDIDDRERALLLELSNFPHHDDNLAHRDRGFLRRACGVSPELHLHGASVIFQNEGKGPRNNIPREDLPHCSHNADKVNFGLINHKAPVRLHSRRLQLSRACGRE